MQEITSDIIPTLTIFKIASNIEAYEKWLKREHNKSIDNSLLSGYKFFFECCFSNLFYHISCEETLGIKTDFLLHRASSEGVFIEKIPSSCEMTIFLKNIYFHFEPILKSKDLNSLKISTTNFENSISKPFQNLYDNFITTSSETDITKNEALKLVLIDNLYIHFNQVKNNGPVALQSSIMKTFWVDKKKLDYAFEGYKYTLQFVWSEVLSYKKYKSTSLINLHKSDSWRKYITYNTAPKDATGAERIFGEHFELEKQTCFDSYFYRIQKEIIRPLEKKYKKDITQAYNFFTYNGGKYVKKNIFGNLLTKNSINVPLINLSDSEKIEQILYWYPVEVMNTTQNQMYNGIPAFNTLLAGTLTLYNRKNSEFKKVIACKFIHPFEENKNDFSYGILIDSASSAGHYCSGWMLFYDCCGDYSGFSGSEHKMAEKLIDKYLKQNKLELRELVINKQAFRDCISEHIRTEEKLDDADIKNNKIQLDDISQRKKR